jgi:valyl-tRNA synthetase
MGAAPGNDLKLDEQRIKGYKNFANKIWNISRFVLESLDAAGTGVIAPEDAAIVDEAHAAAAHAAEHIDKFRLDIAADGLYHFIWHRFADEILEASKPILRSDDQARASSRAAALYESLLVILKSLHPFMPYVTEEIWRDLPHKDSDLLLVAPWPKK